MNTMSEVANTWDWSEVPFCEFITQSVLNLAIWFSIQILIQVSIISSGFVIAQPWDLPQQRRSVAAKDLLPAHKLTQSNTSFSNLPD